MYIIMYVIYILLNIKRQEREKVYERIIGVFIAIVLSNYSYMYYVIVI